MLTGEQDETSLYIVSDVRFVQKPDEPGLSMRILMIDTSGKRTIWAGLDRGNLVDPVVLENQRRHDEHLSSGVVSWLEEHDWQTLDALSVVAGPGSYTGLRVGVSFAVAFALAKEIPLVRLDHFQLEAARLKRGNALVMLPARKRIVRISSSLGESPEPLEKAWKLPLTNCRIMADESSFPWVTGMSCTGKRSTLRFLVTWQLHDRFCRESWQWQG